jgi:hypothetical protein
MPSGTGKDINNKRIASLDARTKAHYQPKIIGAS